MKIYVASSWRTPRHNEVVEALKQAGHEVYDYRKPDGKPCGFSWADLDPEWQTWTAHAYEAALASGKASEAFWRDMSALQNSDVVIGVQPFGVSAALEMGWAAGHGKRTILINEETPRQGQYIRQLSRPLARLRPPCRPFIRVPKTRNPHQGWRMQKLSAAIAKASSRGMT